MHKQKLQYINVFFTFFLVSINKQLPHFNELSLDRVSVQVISGQVSGQVEGGLAKRFCFKNFNLIAAVQQLKDSTTSMSV